MLFYVFSFFPLLSYSVCRFCARVANQMHKSAKLNELKLRYSKLWRHSKKGRSFFCVDNLHFWSKKFSVRLSTCSVTASLLHEKKIQIARLLIPIFFLDYIWQFPISSNHLLTQNSCVCAFYHHFYTQIKERLFSTRFFAYLIVRT